MWKLPAIGRNWKCSGFLYLLRYHKSWLLLAASSPSSPPWLVHKQFGRGLNPPTQTSSATLAASASSAWFASSIGHALVLFKSLMQRRSWLACSFMASLHLGLASFSCCARTPTSHPQLRFALRYFFPHFQRSTPMPKVRRWTLESSPTTGQHVGYAEFPHPFRATVHKNHISSSSSPPTYIASIRRSGCSPYQHAPARPRWRKSWAAALCPSCFHAQLPAKLAFVPYPWALSLRHCKAASDFTWWKP